MNKILGILVSLCLVSHGSADERPSCDKELNDYLGFLAAAAYIASPQSMPELNKVTRQAKKSPQNTCRILIEVKQNDIAYQVILSLEKTEELNKPHIFDTIEVESEIDWAVLPEYFASTDLFTANSYLATVEDCNKQYPEQKNRRNLSVEIFFKKIAYLALKEKVTQYETSKGNANSFRIRGMLAVHGDDTREWSKDMCNSFSSNPPFDSLYAYGKKNGKKD